MNVRTAGGPLSLRTGTIRGGDEEVTAGVLQLKLRQTCVVTPSSACINYFDAVL